MSSFYGDVLGLKVVSEEKGWREFSAGAATIALHSGPSSPGRKGPKIVFYADDVAATRDALVKRGAKFGKVRGAESLCLCDGKDPDGNPIQLSNRRSTMEKNYSVSAKPAATSARPILTGTEAQLFVADVAASCAFYKGKLGFTVAFSHGDPPFYAQVARDGARLNLRHTGQPVFVAGVREREDLLSASLTLANASETKQLFETCKAAKVPFHQPLKHEPWGATTFVVKDPDGNLILFAGPAA